MQHTLDPKYASEPTAYGTDNATLLQRSQSIQKADTCRNWKRLKYDIEELRLRPGKLTKAFQDQKQEEAKEQETTHDWEEWGNYQKTLGELLAKTYPLSKKETITKEPEWAMELENGGRARKLMN